MVESQKIKWQKNETQIEIRLYVIIERLWFSLRPYEKSNYKFNH